MPPEPAPEPPAPAEGDAPAPEGDAAPMETEPAAPVMKKRVKKIDVPVSSTVGGLPKAVLDTFVNEEFEMALQDRVMEETKERKNAVEEYVYSMRSKVSGALAEFRRARRGEKFVELLNATEDWLYEDGEDETKGVYNAKLEELKAIGDPIELRASGGERQARGLAPCSRPRLRPFSPPPRMPITSTSTPPTSRRSAARRKAALDWLTEKQGLQAAVGKTQDPVLLSADVDKKLAALERFSTPIMSKPKPKPPKPEPAPEGQARGGGCRRRERRGCADGGGRRGSARGGRSRPGDAPKADDLD